MFSPIEIEKNDRNGTPLREGDIIAEYTVGDDVWGGKAVLLERPMGVIVARTSEKVFPKLKKENSGKYNVLQVRAGLAKLLEPVDTFLKDYAKDGYITVNLSSCNGMFSGWENVEMLGSFYDDFK